VRSLDLAQADRLARGEALADAKIEHLMDAIGLSEEAISLGTADVSPAARKKLKGIIDRLRTKPHPFTQCMQDLRKHRPDWSEQRRKETCNVLKSLAGRNGKAKTSMSDEGAVCVMLDDETSSLLAMIDLDVLDEVNFHGFATLTAKARKNLKPSDFVFPPKDGKPGRYPIQDLDHARNALARSSGKPEEAAVKAAVYKKFPQLKGGS